MATGLVASTRSRANERVNRISVNLDRSSGYLLGKNLLLLQGVIECGFDYHFQARDKLHFKNISGKGISSNQVTKFWLFDLSHFKMNEQRWHSRRKN